MAWNLSNKEETSAIFKSSCSKTSGFIEEDISDSGKWLYRTLTGEKSSAKESGQNLPQALPAENKAVLDNGDMKVTTGIKNSWDADTQ